MNKNSLNNKNTAQIGPAISSNIRRHVRDVAPSSRSTYDKICLFCIYSKTFTKRLVKDILKSLVRFWFPNQVPLASHLADLISTHERLRAEREFHTITYSRGTTSPHTITEHGCFGQYLRQRENEPTSECHHYIASEDSGLHTLHTLNQCPAWETPRREPWLAARMRGRPAPPSESNGRLDLEKGHRLCLVAITDIYAMEPRAKAEVSEDSIDVAIPSFPGSPRSFGSVEIKKKYHNIEQVVDFLEHDDEFLIAAELGDEKLLTLLLQKGVDVNKKDHLERNALHLAVCSGNRRAVLVLLNAGVTVNVKSNVGMTPLSLCLMRRPSWRMANMLFDYGAIIVPRNTAMDTGLFLQFVMMCIPTKEEERILRLLVEKGALVDDPSAPGGRQALHFAAMSNNCRLIKILLDMGANPLLTNHRHQTPKQVAVTYQCKDAHKLLAEIEETMLKEKEL